MEHFLLTFLLNYQNIYDHQTFQDSDILQGAAWHTNGVVLWGHMTKKLHIFTCSRCIDTTILDKAVN